MARTARHGEAGRRGNRLRRRRPDSEEMGRFRQMRASRLACVDEEEEKTGAVLVEASVCVEVAGGDGAARRPWLGFRRAREKES